MRHTKKIFISTVVLLLSLSAFGQWNIPEDAKNKTAPTENSIDAALAGKALFDVKCKACHQDPGVSGLKSPAPPDLGTKEFLVANTDGEIFYKLSEGMGGMPSFKDQISEEQRWSIVHYLAVKRQGSTINLESAKQDLEIKVQLIDESHKIKATVSGDKKSGVKVAFYVKRYFGLLPINKAVLTDSSGVAYATFPADIPGDEAGGAEVVVKFTNPDRNGKAEVSEKVSWAVPTHYKNPLDERAMWGVSAKAPLWIMFSYLGVTLGVWFVIIYVLLQILKLKKAGKQA